MRLQRYITEGKTTELKLPADYGEKDDKIVELIKTNCKSFLKQLSGSKNFLYRGVNIFDTEMMLVKPRKLRQPRDMDPEIHKILDSYFQKKFGWKPRSQGVFGSGSMQQAMLYGVAYTMWPIGKFSILWTDETGDLYVHIKRLREKRVPRTNFRAIEEMKPDLLQLVNTYKKSNLKKALGICTEVMVQTNSYYLLDMQFNSLLRNSFLN